MTCRLHAAPDMMLRCDANKMQRVFDNLLRNAVFYGDENSAIDITATQDDASTAIQFVNRGETIPEDRLVRIFEQFYRLDAARGTNHGGAGLGLAIAKEIVERHAGQLSAQSENEQTTLIFDEVDAGVGGLTLNRVADRLDDLSRRRQLLLITHWPQLASRAGRHFHVAKHVRDGETYTTCRALDSPEVREELTRMAGGGPQGEALARELIGAGTHPSGDRRGDRGE